jgi:putative membrane protein
VKRRLVAGAAATATLIPALTLFGGAAVAAGSGGVRVSNTETVQAYLDPTGRLEVARVYEQVALRGTGTVALSNPVEAEGLRNLDGFGGFEVKDGAMVGTFDVDGEQRLRTVSDYTRKLPLEVKVSYVLDGKPVAPEDVVGRSGLLEVRYTVRNVTGTPRAISFDDGTGGSTTSTEQVVIPMVGSLTTTLPTTFTDVSSGEANVAGDGRGGTKLTFTMTLFGPIGAPETSFGYTARIVDGTIPKASVSALPVSPLASPSFKGGAESYKGGAETGAALASGATEIDANLLKLRDGAATLLAGLIQLRDGAKKLDAGLGSQILPGSQDLADGAAQLKDGTGRLRAGADEARAGSARLSSGAGQVASGAGQLDVGAGRLAAGLVTAEKKAPLLIDGLGQVADGLELLDAGLVTLHGSMGELPAKAKPLHEGIARLRAGIGAKGQANTLIDGVEQVRSGLAAATADGGSVDQLKGGVDQVQAGLADGVAPGGGIDQLAGGVQTAKGSDCGPVCQTVLDQVAGGITSLRAKSTAGNDGLKQVSGGLGQLKTKLSAGAVGLAQVECGLSNQALPTCPADRPGLLEGLAALDAGVGDLVNKVVTGVQGAVGDDNDVRTDKTLRGGVHSLQGGIDEIGLGGMVLLDGLGQLRAGAGDLKAGTGKLAAGSSQVADGAGELSSGLGTLAEGAGRLDDGAGALGEGAGRLADGLATAADGSAQLATGLQSAADGAPALQDGAQRLSDEGTSKLVVAGKETAADYGKKYALIEAGADRAVAEGMAYGAPKDAVGFTAYSLEIAGVDGDTTRNAGQAAAALGVFGAAGGLVLWRRRLVG